MGGFIAFFVWLFIYWDAIFGWKWPTLPMDFYNLLEFSWPEYRLAVASDAFKWFVLLVTASDFSHKGFKWVCNILANMCFPEYEEEDTPRATPTDSEGSSWS